MYTPERTDRWSDDQRLRTGGFSDGKDGPGAAGVITSTMTPQFPIQFAMKWHF